MTGEMIALRVRIDIAVRCGAQRALKPDVISYNAAMSACDKGRQWQRALEVMEGMPQRALKPDVIGYSAAISACDKGGQWQRALDCLLYTSPSPRDA